jgi:hypothetical protein
LLLFNKTSQFGFGNEKLTTYVAIILALAPIVTHYRDSFAEGMWLVILLFFFIQLSCIAIQYCNGEPLDGTYKNTGVTSCYLVIHIPLVYYFVVNKKGYRNKRVHPILPWMVFALIYLVVFLIILANQSRTALMALFLLSGTFIVSIIKPKLTAYWGRHTINKLLLCCLLALIVYSVYCVIGYFIAVKQTSFNGRLLIWKIGWQHINQAPWLGHGFGCIPLYYPQWQSAYFLQHAHPSTADFLCAGETHLLFNDQLQLLLEVGWPAFILFYCLLGYLFSIRVKEKAWGLMLKSTLFTLLLTSLSAYPLETNTSIFIFLLCITSLLIATNKIYFSIHKKAIGYLLLSICLLIALPLLYTAGLKSTTIYAMHEHSNNNNLQYVNDDGKALACYGIQLIKEKKPDSAIYYLEKSKTGFISYRSINALAKCYLNNDSLNQAIKYYSFLATYIPNKLMPKYVLFQIYLHGKKDTALASAYAQQIMTMPIKVPSGEVNVIKKDVQNEIEKIQKPY